MKNTVENIKAFAYVNIDNPMVSWETAIGRIISHDENQHGLALSLRAFAILREYAQKGYTPRFINELRLELIRKKCYPNQVSRLKGIYLFDSNEKVEMAFHRWRIRINKSYITQVNFSATRVSRLDSEWITTYLATENIEDDSWIHSYWKGETCGENPLTELIADGIGLVCNNELRRQAYHATMKRVPTLSKGLGLSAYGFYCGHENVGQMFPSIQILENNKIRGQYLADFREFTENFNSFDFKECIKLATKNGIKFTYDKICDETNDIIIPEDFKGFEFILEDDKIFELMKEITTK